MVNAPNRRNQLVTLITVGLRNTHCGDERPGVFLVYFPVVAMKLLKEERISLANNSSLLSIIAGKSRWQELERFGHTKSTVKRREQ